MSQKERASNSYGVSKYRFYYHSSGAAFYEHLLPLHHHHHLRHVSLGCWKLSLGLDQATAIILINRPKMVATQKSSFVLCRLLSSLFQASNFCTVSGSISDLTPSFTTSQRPCKIFAKLGKSDCGIFCSISLRLSKIRLPTHSCCGLAGEHFRFSKVLHEI